MDRKSSIHLVGCAIAIVIATCVLAAGVVNAQMPIPPPIVSGNVTINGEEAPIGTVITAKVDDEVRGTFVTKKVGEYSISFNESSEEDTGKIISFYVNDIRAEQTAVWKSALYGGIYTIDLAVVTKKTDSGSASDSDSGSSSASTPEITPTPTPALTETEGPSPSPAVPEMPGIPGIPPMPDSFYGNVEINGEPAPNGTVVRAYIDGKECGNVTVIKEGEYADGINTYLDVRGNDTDIGKQVNFTVDGAKANESAPFNPWDGPMQLNLSVQKPETGEGEGFLGSLSSFFPLAVIAVAVIVIAVVAMYYVKKRKERGK